MKYIIREMKIEDYDKVYIFWKSIDGLEIDESDTLENIAAYLKRNPRLSYLAIQDDQIIGTIKCGQDGRRGYIYHMAVDIKYRKQGLAKELYSICIEELKRQGIFRCNIYILDSNTDALSFWHHNGWQELEKNFKMLQKKLE